MEKGWCPSSSSPVWPGLLGVSALARLVSRSVSRLWPSLLDLSTTTTTTTTTTTSSSSSSQWWWRRFDLQFGLTVLDSVVWPVVVAVESVALVSMLCFFFLFCGCNI